MFQLQNKAEVLAAQSGTKGSHRNYAQRQASLTLYSYSSNIFDLLPFLELSRSTSWALLCSQLGNISPLLLKLH